MIPRPGKKTAAVIAALILLPGLLYAPAGDGPFLFDDETGVLELTAGHADQSLGQVLRFWEKGPLAYRPLRFLSFAADWKLGGGDPTVFHITNIILHGLCCLLLLGLFVTLCLKLTDELQGPALRPVLSDRAAFIAFGGQVAASRIAPGMVGDLLRGGSALLSLQGDGAEPAPGRPDAGHDRSRQ